MNYAKGNHYYKFKRKLLEIDTLTKENQYLGLVRITYVRKYIHKY